MTALIDLAGQTFGRLTVLERVPSPRKGAAWLCRCDCGSQVVSASSDLRTGNTRSCGCLFRDGITTHGLSKVPEYNPWKAMMARCTNPAHDAWNLYGGRGIEVHPALMTPQGLIAEIGPRPSPKHTIERIDTDGNYEPGNICWATMKEQNNNRRNNHLITHDGRTQCLAAWARELGISRASLYRRLRVGWTVERALTQPARHRPVDHS